MSRMWTGIMSDETQGDARLRCVKLSRHYRRGSQVLRALDGVDLELRPGEFLALVGASGSGKSTLLNLAAGLDRPSEGRVEVDGRDLAARSPREIAEYRARQVGMIFQSFNLIGHYTALENVALALAFADVPRAKRKGLALERLAENGLGERAEHRPADLSGGEQQRVAVARALVSDPELIFADEPTGNLDRDNSEQIASLLAALCAEGRSVLMTTHDLDMARRHAGRIVRLDYGRVIGEEAP